MVPLGLDATAAAAGLPAQRTVAVDTLFPIAPGKCRRRVLMPTPATRADYRDAAHALFARDGKAVSVTTNARYVRVRGLEEIEGYEAPTAEAAEAMKAATKILAGTIVMIDAGYAAPGATATGKIAFNIQESADGLTFTDIAGAGFAATTATGKSDDTILIDVPVNQGYLRYQYVSNGLDKVPGFVNANTDELYAAITVGVFTAKYSYSVYDLFGTPNSKGSGYLDLSANFDLGDGWSVVPHVGRQGVRHNGALAYTDYALTLNKDFGNGLSASAAVVGTNADKALYVTPSGRFTGKPALMLGLKYSF
mgnify:CR=1 FL=1